MSAAPATLDTTEVDALKDEVARYRLALHAIATLGGTMALHAKTPTAAAGFSHLPGLASDALEQTCPRIDSRPRTSRDFTPY